jgi:hypothetical protein
MWRIYYDDGRTFGSDDGAWSDAPTDGVLFVIEKRGDRVLTHSGADWYFCLDDDGTIVSTGDPGPMLRKLGGKAGRWTSHKTYEEIGRRVANDAKALQRGY